ncbi:hypothetical protein QBC40DRAFT_311157 [Triangularia verruculosa]|uniref:Uncharacterized protein n=1 Tax=Triangularia verruculosa TaxID=2587418 RepID=A0AAN7APR1_9PEZI|nr:hypothetical protein QBC40DRAFT_311157 [Triangularia verruculosa]
MTPNPTYDQQEDVCGSVKGAPHLKADVIPVWWSHVCSFQANNLVLYQWEESRYTDPAQRPVGMPCPAGCGYLTTLATILYNHHRQPIETISGINQLPSRHIDTHMLCCQCWHWEVNTLMPIQAAYSRKLRKVLGVNCCRHCACHADLARDHQCNHCMAYNIYGEITRYMNAARARPENSVSWKHEKAERSMLSAGTGDGF